MNVANYICGGYVITMPAERIDWGAELLPAKILSISSELCERIPDHLAMPWANIAEDDRYRDSSTVKRLGLSRDTFRKMGIWLNLLWKTGGLKWMDTFAAPEIAQSFIRELSLPTESLTILGFGLARPLVDEFLERCRPSATPSTEEGREETGDSAVTYGTYEMMRNRGALAFGGEPLGFEPAGYEHGDFTSWLIHHLHSECHQKLGVRPNDHGLIERPDDALRCADYIRRDETGKEPGWWHSWLLVRYPVT